MNLIKKHLKKLLDMQQMQVVVMNMLMDGLRTSTAVFPGRLSMPMRVAVSVLTVPVTTALSTAAVMPTATGPK